MWLAVVPLQIWWEQAVSMMVWSTAMGRASSPAVNTSACVWTVPSAAWLCVQSPNLPGCGAKPHAGSKSGDSAVSSGSAMNPREGARRPRDTQWRVGLLNQEGGGLEGGNWLGLSKVIFCLVVKAILCYKRTIISQDHWVYTHSLLRHIVIPYSGYN